MTREQAEQLVNDLVDALVYVQLSGNDDRQFVSANTAYEAKKEDVLGALVKA